MDEIVTNFYNLLFKLSEVLSNTFGKLIVS